MYTHKNTERETNGPHYHFFQKSFKTTLTFPDISNSFNFCCASFIFLLYLHVHVYVQHNTNSVYTHAHAHIHVHACTHVHTNACMHVHTHARTHTHMHAHMHTHRQTHCVHSHRRFLLKCLLLLLPFLHAFHSGLVPPSEQRGSVDVGVSVILVITHLHMRQERK